MPYSNLSSNIILRGTESPFVVEIPSFGAFIHKVPYTADNRSISAAKVRGALCGRLL